MTETTPKREELENGSYTLSVIDKVAHVTFVRTDAEKKFKLSEILKAHGLVPDGKPTIEQIFWCYTSYTNVTVETFSGPVHKAWLQLLRKPLTEVLQRVQTVRLAGKQTEMPTRADQFQPPVFEYAYTRLTIKLN